MPNKADIQFGELAVAVGCATREQVNECLSALRKSEDNNQSGGDKTAALRDVMVQKGYLAQEQADKVWGQLGTSYITKLELPAQVPQSTIPDDDPLIGLTMGNCTICERLDRGGMSIVYKAQHNTLNLPRIIKILKSDLADDPSAKEQDHTKARDRFLREARLAATLRHPNVVTIHDANVHTLADGKELCFIEMELIEGKNLKSLIGAKKRLDLTRSIEIMRQISEGVAAAHKEGIIHRDLKPGNILIDHDGTAKVADFGLAKQMDQPATFTFSGPTGTPSYMAPEQWEFKQTDARTDIYALGGTFYYIVTARPPFDGEVIQLREQHLNEKPRPPKDYNPEIPDQLDKLILKMLGKEPQKRPQTMADVVAKLAEIEESLKDMKGLETGCEEMGWWSRRSKVLVLSCVIIALMFAGLVLTLKGNVESSKSQGMTATPPAMEGGQETVSQEVEEKPTILLGTFNIPDYGSDSARREVIERLEANGYRVIAERDANSSKSLVADITIEQEKDDEARIVISFAGQNSTDKKYLNAKGRDVETIVDKIVANILKFIQENDSSKE